MVLAHGINIYAPCSNGPMTPDLIMMSIEIAAPIGKVPVFTVGYFSICLDDQDLNHIMHWGGLGDMMKGLGATCQGPASTESNIDHVL